MRAGRRPGKKGQLLAEIDPTDFHIQGQADAAAGSPAWTPLVAQAERFAERQQRNVAQGFISKNGADDAPPSATQPAPSSPRPAPAVAPAATTWAAAGRGARRGRHRDTRSSPRATT